MRPNSPYLVPRNFYGQQVNLRTTINYDDPIGTGSFVPPYGQLAPTAAGPVERRLVPWPGAYARALIVTIPKADFVDGETLTLNSIGPTGFLVTLTFEFDPAGDGVAGGNVAVDISGDVTAAQVATKLAGVINAQEALGNINVRADTPITGAVWIRQTFPGTGGNLPIVETVADTDFLVNGMAAGPDYFRGGLNPSALAPCVRGGPVRGINRADYGCAGAIWGMNPQWPPNIWCDSDDIEEEPA